MTIGPFVADLKPPRAEPDNQGRMAKGPDEGTSIPSVDAASRQPSLITSAACSANSRM
jgi:hypothetical protein